MVLKSTNSLNNAIGLSSFKRLGTSAMKFSNPGHPFLTKWLYSIPSKNILVILLKHIHSCYTSYIPLIDIFQQVNTMKTTVVLLDQNLEPNWSYPFVKVMCRKRFWRGRTCAKFLANFVILTSRFWAHLSHFIRSRGRTGSWFSNPKRVITCYLTSMFPMPFTSGTNWIATSTRRLVIFLEMLYTGTWLLIIALKRAKISFSI